MQATDSGAVSPTPPALWYTLLGDQSSSVTSVLLFLCSLVPNACITGFSSLSIALQSAGAALKWSLLYHSSVNQRFEGAISIPNRSTPHSTVTALKHQQRQLRPYQADSSRSRHPHRARSLHDHPRRVDTERRPM